jgi:Fe2+ or Zn2+ uptake regulation protein
MMNEQPTMTLNQESIVRLLSEHGHRVTSPRRRVIDAVLGHEHPFTAEQIVAEAPEAGRATVYRTLELLASVDILSRILRADGHPAYVVGSPGHRHHLVCSGCGATIDELVEDLRESTHYAIAGHHLEVFGTCPTCTDGTVAAR